MGTHRNLSNKRFGRLMAVEEKGIDKNGRVLWYCVCDCGNSSIVKSVSLINGNTQSCGCLSADMSRSQGLRKRRDSDRSYQYWYSIYKRNANKRKLRFDLSFSKFCEIIKLSCHYCGDPPSMIINPYLNTKGVVKPSLDAVDIVYANSISVHCNGIDRSNNSLGYVSGNCVPCCTTCNIIKGKLGLKRFLSHITKVHLHNSKSDSVPDKLLSPSLSYLKPIVAFDVDNTLVDDYEEPRPNVVKLFVLLQQFGCQMIIWSNGNGQSGSEPSIEYADRIRKKLGLKALVLEKGSIEPHITVDDLGIFDRISERTLGWVNIQV